MTNHELLLTLPPEKLALYLDCVCCIYYATDKCMDEEGSCSKGRIAWLEENAP